MDRRTFLRTTVSAAATIRLASPAIPQRAAARTLRLVPHADLANFDPVWTPAFIARNAGVLVWDTLYGVDARLQPQRQMIEAEEVSPDALAWTFRLRSGLKFHDGEPVRAADGVASINRWAAREPMGAMIKAVENELAAIDDRTFRWSLKKPFPNSLRGVEMCHRRHPKIPISQGPLGKSVRSGATRIESGTSGVFGLGGGTKRSHSKPGLFVSRPKPRNFFPPR
jgi:ABC-type transport system substrate-binding protein